MVSSSHLLFINSGAYFFCVVEKEVVAKDNADVLQQLGVNAFLLENLVDVGAVTMQLTGKPRYVSVLPA
jgi:hypothetical protein